MSRSDGLWQKGFQLAYLIVHDRASAYRITASAIEKLAAQCSREKKRSYWRFRKTQLRIRRISRTDEDALQWLVYLESEEYEKEQERNDQPTELDMVIRYIKHLVSMTTVASSFYVNVGLNRLLRNYSTPETQQCYEFVTEHYPASEEYRKVKRRLMHRLAERFRGFIKLCTLQYGELKFETYEDQERWITLVDECLEAFTPWSSRNACVDESLRAGFGEPGVGVGYHAPHNHADGIETNRCHWFMHSPCYEELVKKLGLDPPRKRLAVPRFLHNGRGGRPIDFTLAGRRTQPLSERELEDLEELRHAGQARQQEAPLQPLKVVAQGVTYAHLDPARDEQRQFAIPEGTKLLEVRTDTAGTDLILATHWIDYTEWNGIVACEYTIALKNSRELFLKFVPPAPGREEEGGATVVVGSRSRSWFAASWKAATQLALQRNLPGYALASALLVGLGWLGGALHHQKRLTLEQRELQGIPARGPQNAQGLSERELSKAAPAITTYLVPFEDRALRGPGNAEETMVTFAPGDSMVMLDLLLGKGAPGSYRATLSPFLEEQELLTQNLLKPKKRGADWVVEFPLPSSLVTGDTHYLITLSTLNNQGKTTPVARFLFKVRK